MTYEHIIDEQGMNHVKIDENQTYNYFCMKIQKYLQCFCEVIKNL